MKLLNLPVEVILIIIKYLDLKSIESIYNTCRYMRNVVCIQGCVKHCQMSKNAMATAKTLKSNFFKDISGHIQKINMCGVPNLYKTSFSPVLKMLKCLTTLDVSYTYLDLDELGEICKSCPTLKNICINITKVLRDKLSHYQNDFQRLENVHFIGSLVHYDSALLTLEKANIDTFKYSVLGRIEGITSRKAKCKQLFLYFFDTRNTMVIGSLRRFAGLSSKENDVEYIVINKSNLYNYHVYSTLTFKSFFKVKFGLDTEFIDTSKLLEGNTVIMFFDKQHTKFDEFFFRILSEEIKQYLPYFCKSNTETLATEVANESDWFYITPTALDMEFNRLNDLKTNDDLAIKKKRTGEPNFVLNYDDVFKEKERVKLSLGFKDHNIRNAALDASSEYLKKLTFLSLCGRICYSSNFFNVLFINCSNLVTLDIECHFGTSQWISGIAKYIPLSRCLKNFRLISSRIQFSALFKSLSECKTLENIHIEDFLIYHLFDHEIPYHIIFGDLSLIIEKCDKLHSLFVHSPIPTKPSIKISQQLNIIKARLGKTYLNLVFCKSVVNKDMYPHRLYLPVDPLPFDLYRK